MLFAPQSIGHSHQTTQFQAHRDPRPPERLSRLRPKRLLCDAAQAV